MMNKYLLSLALLSVSSTSAYADTLMLKNGDRISGTITTTEDSQILSLKTKYGQTLAIPQADVQEWIKPTKAATTSPKPEAVIAPIAPTSPSPIEWSGRVNFGTNWQTGNTDKEAINTDATVKARWNEKHRASTKIEYHREKDEGVVTENNKFLNGEYDYFFDKKWFSNTTASFETDELENLDLRSDYGLGIGYQFFERDDLNLKFIGGGSYLHEKFDTGNTEESIAMRWVSDYDQKFFDGLIQLFHDHKILVPTEDTEDFFFDSQTGVRVPIKKGLVATTEVEFDWDNKPEQGVSEDDTQYTVKLGYEW